MENRESKQPRGFLAPSILDSRFPILTARLAGRSAAAWTVVRVALGLALLLLAPACREDRESAPSGPIVTPRFSGEPSVPPGAAPPVSLIWNIGFTENVPLGRMEDLYVKFLQLRQDLWNVTEGQICLGKIRFFDAVAPGAFASDSENLRVPTLDVVLYPPSHWNIAPISGQVIFFSPPGTLGRTDRRIDVPENVHRLTLLHEGSHFAWRLTWSGNNLPPGLDDEYNYDPHDPACIMDLMYLPMRWCSGGSQPSPNHVPKGGGQGAQSCWEQIRLDYPSFLFSGISSTSSPLPPLEVEYNDAP